MVQESAGAGGRSGQRLHQRTKAHGADGAGCDVDLEPGSSGIRHCGVQNAIEVHGRRELDLILCEQHARRLTKNLTVGFQSREYQVTGRGGAGCGREPSSEA